MACVARFFYAINHQFGFAGNANFFIMLPRRKTRYNDNNFYSGFIQLYLGFHLRCTVFWLRVQIMYYTVYNTE